jgi:hypothetical protein
VNEGYDGSAVNFTHCMIFVLSFESKIRKAVKVSDDDTIKENFLDLNLRKIKIHCLAS